MVETLAPMTSVPSVGASGYAAEAPYWTLEQCKRAYTGYLGAKRDEILEQQNARSYRHGAHWTSSQIEVLNRRKQPVVTYNRIGRKIDAIVGLMERLKQDPKAYPRTPRGEQGAELATASVRYVVETQLREFVFPFSIENGAVDGIGGVEMMLVEGDQKDPDIGFTRVNPDSFFYDPCSYEHDFSDAAYSGQGKWLLVETVKNMFPEKADELEGSMTSGYDLSSNPDRERQMWTQGSSQDGVPERIRVVDIWYRHGGGWCWCIFTGGMKLAEGQGYFYDELGKQISKYIMFSAFVDQDGDRYGFPRNLRSSQDEINQRRSKGLHELMSRRIKAEDGAFADVEVARREAVRSDGVVIYQKGFEMEFDDAARVANIEGQFKFLEDAKNEIENFGPNPALIGQGLEYKSGRAINMLQQAGIAELGPFVVSLKNWKLRLYRAIWSAVQRYWTAERWIRVTDDQGVAQFVQVNGVGIDQNTGLPQMVNMIGQLDVNFTLDEGPDEVNMMADSYDALVAMATQGAKVPPQILIELAPLSASVKRKLLAILSQPDPMQQQAQQIALASESAKVEETRSRAALNVAKAQETAQGGAHGIVERQMDAAMKQQEFGMKQANEVTKLRGEAVKGTFKARDEFVKLRAGAMRAQQDLAFTEAKNAQQLRHAEEMQRKKMAAAPPGGSDATKSR